MTLIKLLTRISVITWELEHHVLACELLVHSGECVQLQQERISVQSLVKDTINKIAMLSEFLG